MARRKKAASAAPPALFLFFGKPPDQPPIPLAWTPWRGSANDPQKTPGFLGLGAGSDTFRGLLIEQLRFRRPPSLAAYGPDNDNEFVLFLLDPQPIAHSHLPGWFTLKPATCTLPPATAWEAWARVLKKRAAHSHLSSRTCVSSLIVLSPASSALFKPTTVRTLGPSPIPRPSALPVYRFPARSKWCIYLCIMKLNTVGIKDIRYPVRVREKSGGMQETVASISLQVSLPSQYRESCVSTFIKVLNTYQDEMSNRIFRNLLAEMKEELRAESAHVEMTFPYFLEKIAPVTGTAGLMEYTCRFTGGIGKDEDFILAVWVPVTTLCPCSREISDCGAHNQRGEVNLTVKYSKFIWMEDLIAMAETGGSCEVYSLLKRPDEKYVTEKAYNNPMFVEDAVRKVAEQAMANPAITWFSVSVESFESIHKHSAYAYVDSDEIR